MKYQDSSNHFRFIQAFAFCVVLAATVSGQAGQQLKPQRADNSSPHDDAGSLTTFEEEMLAKRAIRLAEKEHQQNVTRAREVSQLAKELEPAAKQSPVVLHREALRKIDRIEKLTKKIRGDAGGEDGEISIPDRPNDLAGTILKICQVADSLSKNVQNTPRQVVSASVIDNANVLLELIKFARTLAP